MENKDFIVNKLLCVACLCVGRTLKEVTDQRLQQYYLEILGEIPLCNTLKSCPSLCWECTAMLRKSVLFREQVQRSHRTLQAFRSENFHECLLSGITRTHSLQEYHFNVLSFTPGLGCDDADIIESADFRENTEIFVKDEVKDEFQIDLNAELGKQGLSPLSPLDDNDQVENVSQHAGRRKDKKKRKKRTRGKARKVQKIIERLKSETQRRQKKSDSDQRILTIDLSYEEMLEERVAEAATDKYMKSEFKCESCILGFNHFKSYKAHLDGKHAPELGEYVCPICYTVISSVESFTSHYKRHMKRFECSICHKRTADMKGMQHHYFAAHEIALKEYKCTHCETVSKSFVAHRSHCDSHKARVGCPQCDKTFSHRAGLMNHRLAVHESQNEFPCPECNKIFRWKTSMKRHLETHGPKDNYTSAAECSACGISFASLSSYQRHLRNSLKHVSPQALKFTCDHCGGRFADKTKLRDHIEYKHLHKTYQCPTCMKPSKNRVALDQHIRNVHKGRPNDKICHHCGKGFPTRLQLESHIRTHTGERPFNCQYCPTTFSQQSNLYKHTRQVHLNIKAKRYPIAKRKEQGGAEPTMDPSRQMMQFDPEKEFVL